MSDKKCPVCSSTLADGALRCQCGYNPEMSAAHVAELKKANQPKKLEPVDAPKV